MRRSRRLSSALLIASVLAFSLGAASCGGGSGGSSDSDLVLVGFNVPNIAGVPLNQPLIFTFSAAIDPSSITPDTLRVTGAIGPNFETTKVDGNLVALLPRSPNFEDYSDAGLLPGVRYTVSLAVFPAPATIRTPDGKPLLDAESFQFDTVPAPAFIEPRRPINHTGLAPSQGGTNDNEGCLNNAENTLPTTKQYGSDCQPCVLPDGTYDPCCAPRLLCLQNEGPPQVILDQCEPTHNDQAVGVPSAVTPGFVNLPALRVRLNEPLDPITVVPYVPSEKLGLNVQLWLVGDTNRIPLPPRQIRTNKPLIVQSLDQTEIILVASNEDIDGNPVGGVPQGTYLINTTSAITDLPGLSLDTAARPSPAIGGFQDIEDNVNASGDVPPGYRLYFVTLVVPGTAQSIIESFANNLSEWGDQASGTDEPGVFTLTDLGNPLDPGDDLVLERIPGSLSPSAASPEYTLLSSTTGCGQSTTANWNGGFRFLGLGGLAPNTDINDGLGMLKAVWKPYLGDAQDGAFLSDDDGSEIGLSTDSGSIDGDGIYEYESFHLQASDSLNVNGSQPLLILCRGDFTVDGTILMNGGKGGPGLDTDGNVRYTNPGSIPAGGPGGAAGPGGGAGGAGGNPVGGGTGKGIDGNPFTSPYATGSVPGGGGGFINPSGGGGGGMSVAGGDGTLDDATPVGNGGAQAGDPHLATLLSDFAPDRCYSPNATASGGTGGGGGGIYDQDGSNTPNNGDDGGGGGGGAGGGIYVIAGGTITINGTIRVDGGVGGDTFAIADQIVDLGADGVAGGTGADADTVTGISPGALPSGAGGPGGGGSGGTIFLMGATACTVSSSAVLSATGGAGGAAGDADLVGGAGSPGIIVVSSMDGNPITVDGSASVTPGAGTVDPYLPTVRHSSCGQSEWIDLFTPTAVFKKFSWTSNFATLQGLGLIQGVDFDAILEVQGADTLSPAPADGAPASASNATQWTQINANVSTENAVEFLGPPSPIDGKRYVRWRWRFFVPDAYPGFTEEMPAIENFTIEFER